MIIESIDSFLEYWSSVRGRTLRVVRAIPPEHLEWTYQEGKFTLGDLVRHLAALQRHMFAENFAGRPSRYAGHGPELAAFTEYHGSWIYEVTSTVADRIGVEASELAEES